VLPLLRTGLPASALVIGSMAPDLPYFVPVTVGGYSLPADLGTTTHAGWAVVSLDVLIGALAWLLWHTLLAAPGYALAPESFRARLATAGVRPGTVDRISSPARVVAVLVGLAAGSATHVGWDEFTHPGRWGARHVGLLAGSWHGLEGHRWAQYASGVFGAAVLLAWLWRWWRRTEPAPVASFRAAPWSGPADAVGSPPRPGTGWAASIVIGSGAVTGCWAAFTAADLRAGLFFGATRGGAGAMIAALLLALGWHASARRRPAGRTDAAE
jgi:hypothetical protein